MTITQTGTPKLLHVKAFRSTLPSGLKAHPKQPKRLFYVFGACVVSTNEEQTDQQFMNGHDDRITAFAVSNSGEMLATGQIGRNADVVLWDANSGNVLFRFQEHDYEVCHLSFSHDDKMLATVGNERDRKIFFMDTAIGCIVASTGFSDKRPTALAWSPLIEETYTAAAAFDMTVTIWTIDPYKGTVASSPVVNGSVRRSIACLLFSEDGQWLFAGTESGNVLTINVRRSAVQIVHNVCSLGVTGMLWLGEGEIIVGGRDGSLSTFHMENMRTERSTLRVEGSITSISKTPEGNGLVVGTGEGNVLRLCGRNAGNGNRRTIFESQCGEITSVSYSYTDSETLATASSNGTVSVWGHQDRRLRARISEPACGSATCVEVTDTRVISGWSDGNIRCHSVLDGTDIWMIQNAHHSGTSRGVSALCWGSRDNIIASGGVGGEISAWDVRNRGVVAYLKQHMGRVTSLQAFVDNTHILSCSEDGTMKLWDFMQEKCLTTFMGKGAINAMALVEDQVQVVTVGKDRCITFWDLRAPQPQQAIRAHNGEVHAIALSTDSVMLASGGADKVVRLWDYRTGESMAELKGHTAKVTAAQFCPDDHTLVSTSTDGSIIWWQC